MKSIVLFFIIIFQYISLAAQITSISTEEICASQEVLLPVSASLLSNVGALTLYVGYDTSNLVFDTIVNVDPQLAGMSSNQMTGPTQLAFAWSNTVPANFTSTKLFDLKFTSNGNSSQVHFNSGCEITDTGGVVIPVSYINGAINSGLPVIAVNPKDTTIVEGHNALFSVISFNSNSYLWFVSSDNGTSWLALDDGTNYSGAHTSVLNILNTPYSFNNNLYHCILYHGSCQTVSGQARLTVDKLEGLAPSGNTDDTKLSVSPVPFSENADIAFHCNERSYITIQSLNSMGLPVSEFILPSVDQGFHYIRVNTTDWPAGIYYIRLTQTFSGHSLESIIKVLRK